MKAKILEIFSSIQGEGLYLGEEHVFIRFYGCNLACSFCDEKEKKYFSEYTPLDVVKKALFENKKTISLTGGEPLLQAGFLKIILPALKEKGLEIYLETNGTLKNKLLEILDYVDIVSMDIKLPSSTGLMPYWDEHYEFLKESTRKKVFVKVVLTENTTLSDLDKAAAIVASVDKNIPFIMQPVSYNNGSIARIGQIEDFSKRARERVHNVRVIPQAHKILGVK